MGVERTRAVAHVEIVLTAAVGHDIDGPAQGVTAEPRGHHTFINLYMVNETDGQVGKRDIRAARIEGHAINKVAYGIARHTVD